MLIKHLFSLNSLEQIFETTGGRLKLGFLFVITSANDLDLADDFRDGYRVACVIQ